MLNGKILRVDPATGAAPNGASRLSKTRPAGSVGTYLSGADGVGMGCVGNVILRTELLVPETTKYRASPPDSVTKSMSAMPIAVWNVLL